MNTVQVKYAYKGEVFEATTSDRYLINFVTAYGMSYWGWMVMSPGKISDEATAAKPDELAAVFFDALPSTNGARSIVIEAAYYFFKVKSREYAEPWEFERADKSVVDSVAELEKTLDKFRVPKDKICKE